MTAPDDRRDFLAEVAWLHHEFGFTQEEIARRFDVSRSSISRALAEAERLGVIQVVVTVPMRREARLAAELSARLGVAATVGARAGDEPSHIAAARAAARLIERIGDAGNATLAVSWGRTLAAAGGMVRPRATTGIRVVDAVGHPGESAVTPTVEITRALAAALGASVVHLPSPAFVAPGPSLEALLQSEPVRRALELARAADVTLVSVGVAGPGSMLLAEGLVSPSAMAELLAGGAAGEVMGRWLDHDGRGLPAPNLEEVGLTVADLRAGRRVVGVAGGAEKAPAVLAALRGQVVTELVVDDGLAEALLAQPQPSPSAGPAPQPPQVGDVR
jgi:DNA-binding transcriptional regulator LsrR (DeoR family)